MKTLEDIRKFALEHEACAGNYRAFVKAIEDNDEKLAWQTVLGNINWLNEHGAGLDILDVEHLAGGRVHYNDGGSIGCKRVYAGCIEQDYFLY